MIKEKRETCKWTSITSFHHSSSQRRFRRPFRPFRTKPPRRPSSRERCTSLTLLLSAVSLHLRHHVRFSRAVSISRFHSAPFSPRSPGLEPRNPAR
jgi:hypothetical protein